MTENEFILADRVQKIKSINELYDLENNAYISFSGGKDSTVLHYLIDEALPGNRIPRVYINTGIEYRAVVQYVEREREREPYRNNKHGRKYNRDIKKIRLPIQKQRA